MQLTRAQKVGTKPSRHVETKTGQFALEESAEIKDVRARKFPRTDIFKTLTAVRK